MTGEELRFFNPYDDVRQSRNRLPHWQQEGAVYFVTFRLADSLPVRFIREWEAERLAWTEWHPLPWTPEVEREYRLRFSAQFDALLDAGHGSCPLRNTEAAHIVGGTLANFEGVRCSQFAWVVMPNHVHALFVLGKTERLEDLVRSWKTWSARQVNALTGRTGSLWQKDYFDRLVRNCGHFENCVRYIRRNPQKAGLREGEFLLWESAIAKAVQ